MNLEEILSVDIDDYNGNHVNQRKWGEGWMEEGNSLDEVIPGDYDGDGVWEPGIFRPASGLWAIRGVTRVYFGSSAGSPIPAGYDGSGMDGIGIFRESSGLWAARDITRAYYGLIGDIPVTR